MTRSRLITALPILALLAAASVVPAQSPPKREPNAEPMNLDLEQGEPGQAPTGWISTRFNEEWGYAVELVEAGAKSGERCARIVKDTPPDSRSFGNLMQVVDAAPYRGKRVRFRASVRTAFDDAMGRAQLWFRVDRANEGRGFFDNMGDRPIVTDAWDEFEIVGDVAEDAEDINFGMMLVGRGTAWLDAVSIEVVGESGQGNLPARALEGRGLDNLVAFARLLGYVRYFHPTEAVAEADWDAFAIAGVQVVEDAKNPAELAERLEKLFLPAAPTVRVFPTGSEPPLPGELSAPPPGADAELIHWRHIGVGTGNERSIYSSKLSNSKDEPSDNEAGLIREIDAEPYRGKRVKFSAAVRAEVEGAGNQAQLALFVATPQGTGFHDEMEDRPIVSSAWKRYEIVGQVAEDAHVIYVGLGLAGTGTAWYDDVELSVVDGEAAFMPSDFEAVEPGEHPSDWQLQQASPAVSYQAEVTESDPHGGKRSVRITGTRSGEREPPRPDRPHRADLGGGVSCLVPLAVYSGTDAAKGRSVEIASLGAKRPEGWSPSGADRASRLGAVILAWNVFQHFYPYFDVVEADWPETLRRSLVSAAADEDERAFLDTMRALVAGVHDGHGRVSHQSDQSTHRVPVLWDWIEDSLVVTRAAEEGAEGLRPGDVIVALDGRPAGEALRELERMISGATPQWRRVRALSDLAMGPYGSKLALRVRNPAGDERDVSLAHTMAPWGEEALAESRPEPVAELEQGILYVDMGRIDDTVFKENLSRMAAAKGVVFDMRGYPRFNFSSLVAHLIDRPVTSAQWHVPRPMLPDRVEMDYHFSNWTVQPKQPRIDGKVAFLTHGGAISAAETFMGIVEHYGLGAIVGTPTAGTNGNVNPFTLPGGYSISWTGMRVLKHDGSQHHGIGILPTVTVERTIRGISEGRDDQLERALELVKGGA